ncbi:MAG: DUF4316 domain-containing protein [Oscillospiraceae bacterium]|nr:DUF4316 domain-containing protein [Oscillospiraceae bacterium]
MPVQENEIKQKKSEPIEDLDETKRKQIANQQEKTTVQKSGKLLPFLNAKANFHADRIDNLNRKIATRQDKLRKNEAKIERLSEKADKLEDTNKMLKAMLGKVPLVQKMITSNEKKIQDIRENKIPQRQIKCSQHKEQIAKLTHKRDNIQHKLDRVTALSNVITSFTIGRNQERRQNFAKAMDSLNTATFNCMSNKHENLIAKKTALMEKYENSYSLSEKFSLQDKITALTNKITQIENKMNHCQKDSNRFEKALPVPEFSEIQFGKHDFDAVMVGTMDEISSRAETGNFSIPEMAENALTVAVNIQEMSRSDLELFKTYIPDNYLENAEMILEDDYNMIDGILNNGSKEDLEKLKKDTQLEIEGNEYIINHPHISDFIKDPAREDLPKLKEKLARIESALEKMSEIKKEPVIPEQIQKLTDKDGTFKINLDYYKELPKNERHIENFTPQQGSVIMDALSKSDVRFSAVSRGEDKVSLTVAKKDIPALNQIKKDSLSIIVENQPEQKKKNYTFINYDFHWSLPREERSYHSETKDNAQKIMDKLGQAEIPFSAAVREDGSAGITVSVQSEQAYQKIKEDVMLDNAVQAMQEDFFKSVPMAEKSENRKAPVPAEKRENQTGFFSRKQLKQEAQRISSQRSQNPPDKSHQRKSQELE